MRRLSLLSALTVLGATLVLLPATVSAEEAAQENAPQFPGLGDPGKPTGLTLIALDDEQADLPATLVGPDASLQLLVTAEYDSGQRRDATLTSKYKAEPGGIVEVSATGQVNPLSDGEATVTATGPGGHNASVNVRVERFENPPQVNFPNQITPIFTKLGCNGGGCHGKSGGQNGFALSLLGFEPGEDYMHLMKEGRGRRLFPAAPERSLLLVKALGALPHGGGARMKKDSDDYRLLRRWIAQGMPYGNDDDPVVQSIEVLPAARTMPLEGAQQLKILAHFSDGSVQDVTRTAQYTPNNTDMAKADESGQVSTLGLPGVVSVMVRYQGQAAAFQASVPLGIEVTEVPQEKNFIDDLVFKKLKELGLPPSPVCDDSTFLRRVSIDIAGRLPTLKETEQFLADTDPLKREKAIDRLLDSEGYADYFALKWGAILRNKVEQRVARSGNFLFNNWLRNSLKANLPYDELVRGVITASGDVNQTPAVNWYNHLDKPDAQVEDVAQVFLGVRIQCAKCHHHPFEKWSQQDYWGLTAFFSNLKKKPGLNEGEQLVYSQRGKASARNPKTNETVLPTPLGAAPLEISPDRDPRLELADWLSDQSNPFFARSLVNRYWKHFLGRGIVDPEDDMRATNPPSNPELLDALAKHFIESDFDLKGLIRTICSSSVYQLEEEPNAFNARDTQSFSRFYPRRLPAEVMLDSIDTFLGTETRFSGMPVGMQAVELPDHGGVNNQFLSVFGRPAGASACECERGGDVSMAQSLMLLNSSDVYSKLSSSRARELAADKERSDEEKIVELYVRAFSRPPQPHELKVFIDHLASVEENQRAAAFEDILWALMNTKEFLFNH